MKNLKEILNSIFEIMEDMQDTGMYFIVFQNLFIESGFVFVSIST